MCACGLVFSWVCEGGRRKPGKRHEGRAHTSRTMGCIGGGVPNTGGGGGLCHFPSESRLSVFNAPSFGNIQLLLIEHLLCATSGLGNLGYFGAQNKDKWPRLPLQRPGGWRFLGRYPDPVTIFTSSLFPASVPVCYFLCPPTLLKANAGFVFRGKTRGVLFVRKGDSCRSAPRAGCWDPASICGRQIQVRGKSLPGF